ncbi:MAG: polymer-forming cytoskeletal protein [Syntrophomonadaceae bacterium]|jgi:cytoskeletal protein CcmA (bactofilin family)|nr:polymer-forming cytoskeletal protein [Syntrophomonadaceae bacterium]
MARYYWKLICLIMLAILLPVSSLQAAVDYVPAGQVVEGPLLLSGDKIRVDGKVDGDLYAAGNDLSISGEVTGDIIAAGQNISITGPVQGDLRLAAQNIRLLGVTNGSATLFCQDLDFNQQAIIAKDILLFSQSARLDGDLQRNLKGGLQTLYLSGKIGQNVELYDVERLELDEAQIGGDLSYKSINKAIISPDTTIKGEERWKQTSPAQAEPEKQLAPWSIWGGLLINFLGLLIIWGLIKVWRPNLWSQIAEKAGQNLAGSIGIGLLLLLATPLLVLVLCLTVIGIPAAIGILLIYIMVLYASILITAQYLSQILKPKINYSGPEILPVLAWLLVLLLAVKIPFAGWILGLLILSFGLGSIFKTLSFNNDIGLS